MRPNLKNIYENINQGAALFSELDIFSKVVAGMSHMLSSYIDQKIDSLIPDTATGDELKRWAKTLNVQLKDEEDDESLRFRVIDHLRRPPQGGCKWDFERWATIDNVGKAFVFPTYPTLGRVGIACLDRDLKIIDDGTDLSKNIVENIKKYKPITCQVQYVQLTTKFVKLNIHSSSDTTRSSTALSEFFKNHPPGNDEPEIQISTIHRILLESGLRDYELIEPAKKITLESTEVPRILEETE